METRREEDKKAMEQQNHEEWKHQSEMCGPSDDEPQNLYEGNEKADRKLYEEIHNLSKKMKNKFKNTDEERKNKIRKL